MTRAALIVLATAALALVAYGERWILARPAPATSPLSIATCALDSIGTLYGDRRIAQACAPPRLAHAGGMRP
ncbi:MAG: hypothetical protein ACM3JC_07175 [Rudaea sp.]